MGFDLNEIDYVQSLADWGVVFFACFSVAAVVAFFFAPIAGGRRGRAKLYAAAGSGPLAPVNYVLAAAGAVGAGIWSWQNPEAVAGFFELILRGVLGRAGREMAVLFVGRPALAGVAAIVGAFGGFLLLPAVLGAVQVNLGRIWTIGVLTWREAVRKRTLFVFMVFALMFMFAGWFLSEPNLRPDALVKNYVIFVLRTLTWLTLPVVLLLACWGIPDDIKARSMHTVVTKPVRRSEIYLGRILGYTFVTTAVVVVVGVVGYLWMIQQVPRAITKGEVEIDGRNVRFSETLDDEIRVEIDRVRGEPDVYVDTAAGLRKDQPAVYDLYQRAHDKFVGELLTARAPVYADNLSFYDREGVPTASGINVGDIWEYRSYVEGGEGSRARASYTFENVTPALLVDTAEVVVDADGNETVERVRKLRLESSFEAFRTFKGDMNRGLLVQYHFVKDLRRQLADGVAGVAIGKLPARDFLSLRRDVSQGNFAEAAGQLARLADGYRSRQLKLNDEDSAALKRGYGQVAELFEPFGKAWADSLATAARSVANAAASKDDAGIAEALKTFGERFQEHAATLEEKVVDVDVPYGAFAIKEFRGNIQYVGRTLRVRGSTETLDLFDDLVHGGRLKIEVACLDRSQYLGMARPDLFIRTPDKPFAVGFAKALLGVWLYFVLIVVVGVTASTFVKGPVATFLLVFLVLLGNFGYGFLQEVVSGNLKGSGSIESAVRLYTHRNPNVELDQTTTREVIAGADTTIKGGLWIVSKIIPDLEVYWLAGWVANGVDVNWAAGLSYCVFTTLAYCLPCLLVGYYSLRFRELEAK